MVLDFGVKFLGNKENKQASIIVADDGSGDSDDIEEAIKMLPFGEGSIYIKEGAYTISSNIQPSLNNLTIIGAGKATKITCASAGIALLLTGCTNVTIRDCAFYGTTSSSAVGWTGGSNNVIQDCYFQDFSGAAISINGTTIGSLISGCEFNDNARGIDLIAYQFGGGNVYAVRILSNFIHDCTGDGIFLDQDGTVNLDFTIISNNNIQDNGGWGINISDNGSDRTLVVGNIILNNTSGNIQDNGTNTTAANNIIA